jgi:[protein-PII] uridylyltransferase
MTSIRDRILARRPCGPPMERALSRLMDATLRTLAQNFSGSILAVGGYGLGLLAPGSDVDLCLIVPPHMDMDHACPAVQNILYPLWDAGLTVDHSVRTIPETLALAQHDPKVLAGLLTARLVSGTKDHVEALRCGLLDILRSPWRRQWVDWLGDARPEASLLEPDLKNGPGGLRHWHQLGWLAAAFPGREGSRFHELGLVEPSQLQRLWAAAQLLHQTRCALHLTAGRCHDIFHAELHEGVAQRLATPRESLCRHLVEAMALIRLARDAMLREVRGRLSRKPKRPKLPHGLTMTPGGLGLTEDPAAAPHLVLQLLEATATTGITPCFSAQGALQRLTPEKAQCLAPQLAGWLVRLLQAPYAQTAAQTLVDLGLLGVLLPELAPSLGVLPLDGWHRFPVGIHSVRTAVFLATPHHLVQQAPWLQHHPVALEDQLPLLWAGLLHDMGKPHPRHEVHGVRCVQPLLRRLGIDATDRRAISFLIREHLRLFRVATSSDLGDPQVIASVAEIVRTPERLAALTHLAVADALATGPAAWNPWRSLLLAELCAKTLAILHGQPPNPPALEELPKDFAAELPPAARTRLTATDLRYFSQLFLRYRHAPRQVHTLAWPLEDNLWKCAIMTPDRPALFATLAGCFAVSGAHILSAEIMTSSSGIAMDLFIVRLPDTDPSWFWPTFREEACASLTDPQGLAARIAARHRSPLQRPRPTPIPPSVRLEQTDGGTPVLEVRAADRPGLLFDITWELAMHGIAVRSAKISTHGDHIRDIFFLQSANSTSGGLAHIRPAVEAILQRLREGSDTKASPSRHENAAQPPA